MNVSTRRAVCRGRASRPVSVQGEGQPRRSGRQMHESGLQAFHPECFLIGAVRGDHSHYWLYFAIFMPRLFVTWAPFSRPWPTPAHGRTPPLASGTASPVVRFDGVVAALAVTITAEQGRKPSPAVGALARAGGKQAGSLCEDRRLRGLPTCSSEFEGVRPEAALGNGK